MCPCPCQERGEENTRNFYTRLLGIKKYFVYFGYGSNMSAEGMASKGLHPLNDFRAILKDYRLAFNLSVSSLADPSFANVIPDPGHEAVRVRVRVRVSNEAASPSPVTPAPDPRHKSGRSTASPSSSTSLISRSSTGWKGSTSACPSSCWPTQTTADTNSKGSATSGPRSWRKSFRSRVMRNQPSTQHHNPWCNSVVRRRAEP